MQRSDVWIVGGLAAVLVSVVGAMAYLGAYQNAPGASGETPALWPSESRIPREPNKPILIMFAHPMCSCTRASLTELRDLVSELGGRFTRFVYFAPPWGDSDLWSDARSIDGLQVAKDTDEYEAHLFGARTSGYVVVYDEAGRLRYSGGITRARSHVGDNTGLRNIAALLRKQTDTAFKGPVFGCPLEDPE